MIYILFSMVCYSVFLIFIGIASRRLESSAVNMIGNISAAIIPTIIFFTTSNISKIKSDKYGLITSIIAGVFITFYGLFLSKSFTTDKVAIISPIVYGGTILISAIAGIYVFKEKITMIQGIGLVLILTGIAFVIYAKSTGK